MNQDTVERIGRAYARSAAAIAVGRGRLGRPLSLAEKILFGHMPDPATQGLSRGADYAALQADRVALQDATGQMALLQFELAGLRRVQAPTTVHCDHLIQARVGSGPDLLAAVDENERGVQLPGERVGALRGGILEAGVGNHPSGDSSRTTPFRAG